MTDEQLGPLAQHSPPDVVSVLEARRKRIAEYLAEKAAQPPADTARVMESGIGRAPGVTPVRFA